jgi:hypothetical protein
MARKPFKKINRNPPPNSRFNWDMLDVHRYKNEVLMEAREKVRSGEMTNDQARTWLQDEVEAATGHRPEVNKGRMTAAQVAQNERDVKAAEDEAAAAHAAEIAEFNRMEAERMQQEAKENADALAAIKAEREKNEPT